MKPAPALRRLDQAPDVLRVEEVAELLQLCEKTIRTMAREKRLPSFRVGNRLMFSRKRLAEWLEAETQSPGATAP